MSEKEKEKNKKDKKQNKTLTIFLTTFIVTFAFVAMAVKYFSPEIDVEIDKVTDEEQMQDEEDKGSVDERLRWIQFEDNMPGVSTRFTDDKNKEKKQEVELKDEESIIEYDEDTTQQQPQQIDKVPQMHVEKVKPNMVQSEPVKPQTPVKPVVNPPVTNVAPTVSKVYVGQYSTIEQAVAMRNRIAESGLNLAPFVKRVGNGYTVQVGSYSSLQKAQGVVSEIQNAGYAARVVSE